MDLILNDDQVEEVTLDDFINGTDKGIIHVDKQGENHPGYHRDEISKEIIADDAIKLGPGLAGQIHGVSAPSASKYANGLDIKDEDAKARILSKKHNIADVATAKLMDTLGLIDPNDIEKPMDKVRAAAMLSGIVEKITEKGKSGNTIELHLYSPKQGRIENYEVIDVN